MHAFVSGRACEPLCLCVRVRPCAEHARVSTRAYVRDVVLSARVRAGAQVHLADIRG